MIRMAMPSPLAEYLLRLDRSLWDISPGRRDEILTEVHEFLEEEIRCSEVAVRASLAWLIAEHGTPESMGRHFRISEWKDRVIKCGGVLMAPLAALTWMLFMGSVLGVDLHTPGYYTFLADFPCLILVIVSVRGFWRGLSRSRRLFLSTITGLFTGLVFCHEVCGGLGIGMLEHGFYGAFFGLVVERASEGSSLQRGLLDVAGFLLLMQFTYMGRVGGISVMTYGCLAYHLLNGLGIELFVWAAFRLFWTVRQSTFFLAPEI